MVHNPYLEVWRSLSLDQTELNIFCKWSRLNQIWKNDPQHGFTPTYLKFELTFYGIWCQRGREIHKDSKREIHKDSNIEIHKDSKIGGANKCNDIVRGSIKIWSTQVGGASS